MRIGCFKQLRSSGPTKKNRRKGFNRQILLIDGGFLYLYAECKDAKAWNVEVAAETFELNIFRKLSIIFVTESSSLCLRRFLLLLS